MDRPSPTFTEVASASRRAAHRALDIGANRVELLIVELQEERARLFQSFQLILGVMMLGLLAGVAFTLGIMVLLWDRSPLAGMIVLTVIYGGAAGLLYVRFARLQRDARMFDATLEQLRKDRECLATHLQ
jgi:uncharacterized membrane protein YqjE